MMIPAQQGRTVWSNSFLVVVAAVVGVYFFQRTGIQNVLYDTVGVAAASAMFIGIGRNRALPRFAWGLLASGTLLMAIGDIIFGTSQPVPSVADMLYVSAYVSLTLGLIGLIRSEIPNRKESSLLLDAIIVVAGVGIVGILFLLIPAAHPDGAGFAAKAVSLGYPAIDVMLLMFLLRLARRNTAQRTVFILLIAGLFLRLVADSGYALLNFGTTYVLGNVTDAFWLVSYACFGAALLHPSLGRVKIDASSIWATREDFAGGVPEVYPRAAALIQSQALRFRAILLTAGGILLALAGGTLLLGVAWHAPEVMLVSGAYGGSGILIVVASAVTA